MKDKLLHDKYQSVKIRTKMGATLRQINKEIKSWPKWLQANALLLFEEEQIKQGKMRTSVDK